MSRFTLCSVAALLILTSGSLNGQDGRIIDQQSLTLDESLRKQIVSKAEFTSAFKTAEDIFAVIDRVDMREITYLSDGLRVKGFVLAPKKEGRYPVLIWNRGGCRENAGETTPYGLARWVAPFADWGYVVVGSQYRGAAGSEGKDEFGGAGLNDVINLLPLLEALPKADPSRVGMGGFSRGALMTYLALTKTDRIKAAIVGSGPVTVDFRSDAARRTDLGLPARDILERHASEH